METFYKCDGCGGTFKPEQVLVVNEEQLLCTSCDYEQEQKFDAITTEQSEKMNNE